MTSYTEMGASVAARAFFYPSLLYNIARERLQEDWHWCDLITENVMLGAIPFQSMLTQDFRQLGVRAVLTLNEEFEIFISPEQYAAAGIAHLHLPTIDFLFAPPLADLHRGVDFIAGQASCNQLCSHFASCTTCVGHLVADHASRGELVYVHCKAGRGRSTTLVLCYLIKHAGMEPVAALDLVRTKRPQVHLAQGQWAAIENFWRSCGGGSDGCSGASDDMLSAALAIASGGGLLPAEPSSVGSDGDSAGVVAADNAEAAVGQEQSSASKDAEPSSPDGVLNGGGAFRSVATSYSSDLPLEPDGALLGMEAAAADTIQQQVQPPSPEEQQLPHPMAEPLPLPLTPAAAADEPVAGQSPADASPALVPTEPARPSVAHLPANQPQALAARMAAQAAALLGTACSQLAPSRVAADAEALGQNTAVLGEGIDQPLYEVLAQPEPLADTAAAPDALPQPQPQPSVLPPPVSAAGEAAAPNADLAEADTVFTEVTARQPGLPARARSQCASGCTLSTTAAGGGAVGSGKENGGDTYSSCSGSGSSLGRAAGGSTAGGVSSSVDADSEKGNDTNGSNGSLGVEASSSNVGKGVDSGGGESNSSLGATASCGHSRSGSALSCESIERSTSMVWVSVPSMDLADCLGRCPTAPRLSLEVVSGGGSGGSGSTGLRAAYGSRPGGGSSASQAPSVAIPAATTADVQAIAADAVRDSRAAAAAAPPTGVLLGEQNLATASSCKPGDSGGGGWPRWHAILPHSWVGS